MENEVKEVEEQIEVEVEAEENSTESSVKKDKSVLKPILLTAIVVSFALIVALIIIISVIHNENDKVLTQGFHCVITGIEKDKHSDDYIIKMTEDNDEAFETASALVSSHDMQNLRSYIGKSVIVTFYKTDNGFLSQNYKLVGVREVKWGSKWGNTHLLSLKVVTLKSW